MNKGEMLFAIYKETENSDQFNSENQEETVL